MRYSAAALLCSCMEYPFLLLLAPPALYGSYTQHRVYTDQTHGSVPLIWVPNIFPESVTLNFISQMTTGSMFIFNSKTYNYGAPNFDPYPNKV